MRANIDLADVRAGFADPVAASQQVFRGVLDAMSRPGMPVALETLTDFGVHGAVALALLDFETPVWLGTAPPPQFASWLRFHCGCPLAATEAEASFVFLDAADLPDLDLFNAGDAKYPDRAATLVISVPALEGGIAVALEGPGIETRVTIAPLGLDAGFWRQAIENRARFQLGLDLILAAGDRIVGLPRSTRIYTEG
jgi:alpha-D-ribose 1-methylphosphonate 5-triphosphate synthase subunit PhnH